MTNSDLPIQWFVGTLTFMGIVFIIISFITMYAFYQLLFGISYNDSNSIRPLFRNLTVISMLSFCLTSLTDIIHMIAHMMESKSFTLSYEPKIAGIADLFYYIGSISFYSILLCRIHFVFKDSSFRLSFFTLFVICCQIIISGLAAIWYIMVITFFYHDWKQWVERGMPSTYLLSCNDFLLNIFLFILFYIKLKQTINLISIFHNQKDQSINNNMHNRLFSVMAKHSVLFGIAIITNQFFFVGVMLMNFTDLGHKDFSQGLILILILRSIENMINCLALWLVLKYNKVIYRKCCNLCHKTIENVCKDLYKRTASFDSYPRISVYEQA